MYKYYFLKILSIILLTTTAHAGRLVLEAGLSDEQIAVVKQRIIVPYIQNTTRRINRETTPPTSLIQYKHFGHRELPGMTFPYPSLELLKKMVVYTTPLVFQIDEVEAEKLAKHYQETAPFLKLNQIDVDFFTKPDAYNYQEFHTDLNLPTHSTELKWLNDVIQSICSKEKNYELNSFGALVFGKTTLSRKDDRGSLQFEAMQKKVEQLNLKNDRLSLTFKHFNLKYIDDKENVIFSKPLELRQVAQ